MATGTRTTDFQTMLATSAEELDDPAVVEILMSKFPGAVTVERSDVGDDKGGTDVWVYRDSARPISIDLKRRDYDALKHKGVDDLALEIWSNVAKGYVGWTLDESKGTDYVLWYFTETGRHVILPFPPLCSVFLANLVKWQVEFGPNRLTRSYEGFDEWDSEYLLVPRDVVNTAIAGWLSG
jgi:hypothetical protein